ncbi:sigma-70 family RNA polymerase sigma factor [Bacillus sp. REN10]|uniref:sigma-70 family RNA polymerase sigma factor n=1 Tax=Bacillus sp. REN10 TaxID=2782541 RepID=UPI00193C5E7C|nr:sigma-70 family RNA polymerase sigma factor [Bacillus sp. REN10]
MDEELIVKQITRKKDVGLQLLVDHYSGLITAIVRKHLGNIRTYEEECINDVLLAIWNNIKSFDKKKNSFKNWVAAISKYKAIDYKRKYMKNQQNMSLTEVEHQLTTHSSLQQEIQEDVEELLRHLNEKDRELFKQYYLEDVQLETIADAHHTTIDNLYNRLSRGRKKIKKAVQQ